MEALAENRCATFHIFTFYFFVLFSLSLPTFYGTFLADTINFCHLLFLLLFGHVTGNLKEYVEE